MVARVRRPRIPVIRDGAAFFSLLRTGAEAHHTTTSDRNVRLKPEGSTDA
jgi:hypothetical protein